MDDVPIMAVRRSTPRPAPASTKMNHMARVAAAAIGESVTLLGEDSRQDSDGPKDQGSSRLPRRGELRSILRARTGWGAQPGRFRRSRPTSVSTSRHRLGASRGGPGSGQATMRTWRGRSGNRCAANPGSKDVAASWAVRLVADDGREASTIVDVSRTALDSLEFGSVADDTRMALRTQGRAVVENAVRRGEEPPARIICSTQGCRAGPR